jgi:hypothetical protein
MFTRIMTIVLGLGFVVSAGFAQGGNGAVSQPAYAKVSPLVEQEQQGWVSGIDAAAERQRQAVEGRYIDAMDTFTGDVLRQVQCMPFAEKTIWTEYFNLVRGSPWSAISLDNTAGNTLVHVASWKLRNQLLDEYFSRQMLDIVLDPDAQRVVGAALDDRPAAKRLQIRGSDLYNFIGQCQFEKQCIESQRTSGLLAVEMQRQRATEDAQTVISYRSHRPAEQPGLNVTAISVGMGGTTAMVNDVLVREGDMVGQVKVTKISRYQIEFEKGGQKSVVRLIDPMF